ncbi:MAG: ABC transporter permease [Deltaproteobacteria bacterium]|nr:ABC transporter permease [Deltaproteobacteria bacterium]
MKVLANFFHQIGGMFLFARQVKRTWLCTLGSNTPLVIEQVGSVGLRSISTVCFAGFFVGAILVIQLQLMLAQYDASAMLGGLNTSACIREVGPLIISFLLAGKVGAYTTAELGTMRVTEQIDAIRCLGTNPLQYLVVPRFVAIVVSSLLLLVFGLLIGLFGSMVVASWLYNINPLQYLQSVPRFCGGWTVFCGVAKSAVYGTIVASVSTYKGYNASGGAKGVGVAVTECAVYTNLLIVFANTFMSILLDGMHEIFTMVVG